MIYKSIVISSGHGALVRGASGIIDEVDEARRVVEAVADKLVARGVDVKVFHDNSSTSQNENLNTIVDFHNQQTRELDVSVHFNAYVETDNPMGVEVLYVTQTALAGELSAAIADAGDFIDRGAKKRTDLFFLNNTEKPALLIETCFVDSSSDCEFYEATFDAICNAIATVLGGEGDAVTEPPPGEITPPAKPKPTIRIDVEVTERCRRSSSTACRCSMRLHRRWTAVATRLHLECQACAQRRRKLAAALRRLKPALQ